MARTTEDTLGSWALIMTFLSIILTIIVSMSDSAYPIDFMNAEIVCEQNGGVKFIDVNVEAPDVTCNDGLHVDAVSPVKVAEIKEIRKKHLQSNEISTTLDENSKEDKQ